MRLCPPFKTSLDCSNCNLYLIFLYLVTIKGLFCTEKLAFFCFTISWSFKKKHHKEIYERLAITKPQLEWNVSKRSTVHNSWLKKSSFTWRKFHLFNRCQEIEGFPFYIIWSDVLHRVWLPSFGIGTVCRYLTCILRGLVTWTFVQLFSPFDWYHSPFLFPMLCNGQKVFIWSDTWTSIVNE